MQHLLHTKEYKEEDPGSHAVDVAFTERFG